MSIKSAPYYWVECDNCGERCDYGDLAAYDDAEMAVDIALDSEWTGKDDLQHCPACPPLDAGEEDQ